MTSIPIVALIAFIGVAYLYESTKKPAGAASQLPLNQAQLQAQQARGAAIINNPKIVPPQPASPITASFLQALVNKIANPNQQQSAKSSGGGGAPSGGGGGSSPSKSSSSNVDQTSNDSALNVPTDNSRVDGNGNLTDTSGNLIGVSSSGVPVEIAGGASSQDEANAETNAISPIDNAELSAALQPSDSNVTLDTGNSDLGVDPLTGDLIDNNSAVDTSSNDSFSVSDNGGGSFDGSSFLDGYGG